MVGSLRISSTILAPDTTYKLWVVFAELYGSRLETRRGAIGGIYLNYVCVFICVCVFRPSYHCSAGGKWSVMQYRVPCR